MTPIDALAAPIRSLLDSVGTGATSATDPSVSVRETTAELERTDARLRHALDAAIRDWESTAGDDAQTTLGRHRSQTRHAAKDGTSLTSVIEQAAQSVRRAAVELRGILDSFVAAADAMGPALYTPTGVAMILPVAADHLRRAVAVVERTRADLDGQSRRLQTIGRTITPGDPHRVAVVGAVRTHAASAGPPTPGAIPITLPDGSVAYAPNRRAATAVRAALAQQGVPYVWGGTTPGRGLDCSALTQYAYRRAGVELPRLAQDQDTAGYRVDRGELLPGDLAVWSGHVAMYVGNDQMVEAGNPVQVSPVRTNNLNQAFEGFYRPR
ncbi:C40 family peptidase [Williamsia phyllosphaerae]|uniref:Glycoside hydrolase n=1 Tax=Williamsia phyllosphaerae TaxID=885042 RepID=A0ABQ1V1V6_9NOCA|nr:C40 family peptidase [Williamsia phyllosphaerae]GGF31741.1 glycoside hydrolase [Williamsia phyllosphaerae]